MECAFVLQGQGLGLIHWCPVQYIYIVIVQQMSIDKNLMITHYYRKYIMLTLLYSASILDF